MKANEKKNYVEAWTSTIKELGILEMNPDTELSLKVRDLKNQLLELVPQIADAKIQASKKKEVA